MTGVCSTTNLEMVKSLGAGKVIDYTREDFTGGTERYDLILDAVGKKKSRRLASKSQCKKILAPAGKYISVDDGSPKVHMDQLMKELVEAGHIKAVIDRCFTLEQIVAAHRYVDKGHKKGNVVITVTH